jgi:hypothetical protein
MNDHLLRERARQWREWEKRRAAYQRAEQVQTKGSANTVSGGGHA